MLIEERMAIGTLVFDALRRRGSLAWRMGEETPRALVEGRSIELPEPIEAPRTVKTFFGLFSKGGRR